MKNYKLDSDSECAYDAFYNTKKQHEDKRNRNKNERERREYLEDMDYED